ncbi:hypothetical protein [Paraglaciecola polaris]|uniref:Uncharacterized protein n=1 Tax=Paraglaciecola polaris LMG 21857 TaxID=1129793 RepID=K7AIT2_9ALTE|nr:hypothetical protein [Paraglaciecola polaris]GAC35145.1 hypothetical protein GPLA_4266 [Paraglaciecola polaris LMG 21857]
MNKLLVLLLPLLFSLLSFEGRATTNGNVNIERSALLSDAFDSQSLQITEQAEDRDEHSYVGFIFPTLAVAFYQTHYISGVPSFFRQTYDLSSIRAPPSIN